MKTSLPPTSERYQRLQMTMMGQKGRGCAAENQDRVLERTFSEGEVLLIAVADGVSRCPQGAKIAEYLLAERLASDCLFQEVGRWLPKQVLKYLRDLNEKYYIDFDHDPEMLDSACTLSLAIIDQDVAHCFWVGDSPIFFARPSAADSDRFDVTQISIPDVSGRLLVDCFGAFAPFRVKYRRLKLEAGDVLAVVTDGVVTNPYDFAELLNRYGVTAKLLQAVRDQVIGVEFYDDASLVVARRTA